MTTPAKGLPISGHIFSPAPSNAPQNVSGDRPAPADSLERLQLAAAPASVSAMVSSAAAYIHSPTPQSAPVVAPTLTLTLDDQLRSLLSSKSPSAGVGNNAAQPAGQSTPARGQFGDKVGWGRQKVTHKDIEGATHSDKTFKMSPMELFPEFSYTNIVEPERPSDSVLTPGKGEGWKFCGKTVYRNGATSYGYVCEWRWNRTKEGVHETYIEVKHKLGSFILSRKQSASSVDDVKKS